MHRKHFNNTFTNYFHIFESVEIKKQLYYHRNLFNHSCIGVEAMIGIIRSYVLKRTQRGGCTKRINIDGKGFQKYTIAKAVGKIMLRRACAQLTAMSKKPGNLFHKKCFEFGRDMVRRSFHTKRRRDQRYRKKQLDAQ